MQKAVAMIVGLCVFSLSLLLSSLFSITYFSTRRGYPRVLKCCIWSYFTQVILLYQNFFSSRVWAWGDMLGVRDAYIENSSRCKRGQVTRSTNWRTLGARTPLCERNFLVRVKLNCKYDHSVKFYIFHSI